MQKKVMAWLVVLVLIFSAAGGLTTKVAADAPEKPLMEVQAWELIAAMNTLRMSYGLPALIEDPIVNAVAQSTAQIMADTLASWHIGGAPERIQAAGYGGGAKVYATENFAVGGDGITIDQIMVYWADESHMLPAVKPYYCHVGAGTARASNGMTYFVLQAAYVAGQQCAATTYPTNPDQPGPGGTPVVPVVPMIIVPVEVAEADENGRVIHEVKPGQSFWSIAVAYQVTIKDILQANNLSESYKLQIGDELNIPVPGTEGVPTPTPVGVVVTATPDSTGRVLHEVQIYQNLSTIGAAYGVAVDTLLSLNGLTVEDPLQIGQKLLVKGPDVTPTPTTPPLTPIQMLTPAADGMYYHEVREGQNPSWIAGYYGVPLTDLVAWNGNDASRVWYPGEKMLLQVTPPATITPTPSPTPTETPVPTPTATPLPSNPPQPTAATSPTVTQVPEEHTTGADTTTFVGIAAGMLAAALIGYFVWSNRKHKTGE